MVQLTVRFAGLLALCLAVAASPLLHPQALVLVFSPSFEQSFDQCMLSISGGHSSQHGKLGPATIHGEGAPHEAI